MVCHNRSREEKHVLDECCFAVRRDSLMCFPQTFLYKTVKLKLSFKDNPQLHGVDKKTFVTLSYENTFIISTLDQGQHSVFWINHKIKYN